MVINDKNRIAIPIWFMAIVVAAMFALNTDLWRRVRSLEIDVAKITTAMEITTKHDICDAEPAKMPSKNDNAGYATNTANYSQ